MIDADEVIVFGNCDSEDYKQLRIAMINMNEGDIFVLQVLILIFAVFGMQLLSSQMTVYNHVGFGKYCKDGQGRL